MYTTGCSFKSFILNEVVTLLEQSMFQIFVTGHYNKQSDTNEAAIHQRPNDEDVRNYRSQFDLH